MKSSMFEMLRKVSTLSVLGHFWCPLKRSQSRAGWDQGHQPFPEPSMHLQPCNATFRLVAASLLPQILDITLNPKNTQQNQCWLLSVTFKRLLRQ